MDLQGTSAQFAGRCRDRTLLRRARWTAPEHGSPAGRCWAAASRCRGQPLCCLPAALDSLGPERRRGPLPSKGQGRKSRPNEIAARWTRTTEPTRQAGRFNLTLVTDNQRANVLADTDDFVAA